MNERIKELATEVGISVDYLTNTKQIVLLEKFAELIVLECAVVCDTIGKEARKQYKLKYNPWDDGRADGAWQCEQTIKEHFGVE